MLKFIKRLVVVLLLVGAAQWTRAQSVPPGGVLILYDGSGDFGWYGDIHAKMLANLMGHFDLPYLIKPVENYNAGDINQARATFYLGLTYNNPLPAAFTNDVNNATNTICWFKYNMWQVSGNIYFPQPLDSKIGFRFLNLDESGYTNIVYKGISLPKNPLDPEIGVVSIIDTNLASSPAVAWRTNADNTTTNIPYITQGSNFWYVGDSPFDYMAEADRYLAFVDLLHDILGIHHAESHQAIIRIEDVTMDVYDPSQVTTTADLLHSNNVPFCMATIPVYTDPLGFYNDGIPEMHRMSDTTDPISTAFVTALKYAVADGGQVLMHGYTHQYDSTPNPYSGTSADDFEFWRETLITNADFSLSVGLYQPVAEDSPTWVSNRIHSGIAELTAVGLPPVAWEPPHYAASAPDYQYFATNFSLTIQRVLYFADDYDPTNNHVSGQIFPYPVDRDVYGQHIMPENLGDYEPEAYLIYPPRSPADIINAARCNLVVRDGWASAFFHGFYDLTNLQQIVTGVKALGYTYVPLSPTGKPIITFQPVSHTNQPAGTNFYISVAAIGSPTLKYQWKLNGTSLPGATNAVLNFSPAQTNNSGNYTALITNTFGAVTSIVAVLDIGLPPAITNAPSGQTNLVGSNITFTVGASGSLPLAYQWLFNDTDTVLDATNASLTLTNVQSSASGNYSVLITNHYGSIISTDVVLAVYAPPVITNPPASQLVLVSNSVTFTVGVTGGDPFAYQWWFNATNTILGATNNSFTLDSASIGDNGNFTVVITNLYGVVTSTPAVLTVVSSPIITNPPASQTIIAGSNATFMVGAFGSPPLSYQWWFNATNSLGGATNLSLTVTNTQAADVGGYTVVVGNSFGSITSSAAQLNLHFPPVITNPPAGVDIAVSNTAVFTVGVTGDVPLSYQWFFNSSNAVPAATNSTLTISNAPVTAAGNYSVIVTNNYGAVTSIVAALTIGIPPSITNPPASQAILATSNVTFSVDVDGTASFAYQWQFNGTNLAGATTNALTVASVQGTNAGNYDVVVTNNYGAATSSVAVLTVNIPVTITSPPASLTNLAGTDASFSVGVDGTSPFAYQWRFNGTNLAGAITNTLTVASVQETDAGNYDVVVTNNYGAATSSVAILTVDIPVTITSPPASLTNLAGTDASFSVDVDGTAPFTYQWRFNGTNLAGATTNALTVASVQGTNAGNYDVVVTNNYGAATSSVAVLTVNIPVTITNPPADLAVIVSSNATFSVGVSGTAPFAYQWWFNDTNRLAKATNASLTIFNAQATNAGNYTVAVTNNFGAVTSQVATLTINFPPVITNQPVSRVVVVSNNVAFTVGVSGDVPFAYQWRFNGTNIADAITNSLSLTSVQTNDAGGYTVVVTNAYGAVTSSVATLVVTMPPQIITQPQGRTNVIGTTATFNVAAIGTGPLNYQWRFNDMDITGATTNSLSIPNVQTTNAGNYSVVVASLLGEDISVAAALEVIVPTPLLNIQLVPGTNSVSLSFDTAGGLGYYLEYKDALDTNAWQQLTNVTGSGGSVSVEIPTTSPSSRFYRIRVQ